ncbi:MAG: YceI family protein [Halieaceae bacterium]|jgi:polyisoprenoid-binding protein YceI|nr:YceI family protein [Halieaceae bacterium]
MNQWIKTLGLTAMIGASAVAQADWAIAPASSLSYVSVKNNAIAENNTISGLSGGLSDGGELTVSIDLTSVDTGVSIRNERMQTMFFEVSKFATAEVSAQLDPAELTALADGKPVQRSVALTLNLHGMEKDLSADVLAVQAGGKIHVTSTRPVLLNAADFGLEGGVTALREIAGLDAISTAVPVTIHLVLDPA